MGLGFSTCSGAFRHYSASYNRVWFSCVSRVISSSNVTAHIRPYSSKGRQEFDSISQLPYLKSRSDNQKILKGCVSVLNLDAKIGREAAQFRRGVGKWGDYNGSQDFEGSSKIGIPIKQTLATCKEVTKKQLAGIYDKILVVDNISTAKVVVQLLTKKYMKFIHGCHVEVTNFDENSETPVGHGEIICFSIYSGPEADFNEGKSCMWVDVLDGGKSTLLEFAPFFEDSSIKKDSCLSCAVGRIHCLLNINTATGRLSAMRPSLQNLWAWGKDRYKIRQAFIAEPANSFIVADYEQLELRILAPLANCKSMLDAFRAGGDIHSRTATNIYAHVREAVEEKRVLLEWHPQLGKYEPPVPLLKGSAADVTMCAMLEIEQKVQLKELGWRLLLQVHDELILEGPTESAELAKAIVVDCMTKPFNGTNFLKVDLAVDAKIARNLYAAQ